MYCQDDEDSSNLDKDSMTSAAKRLKLVGSKEIKTHVFVWGLNDKDQLGGPKGSKIKTPILSEALSAINCVQIAGGSKCLFCGESLYTERYFGLYGVCVLMLSNVVFFWCSDWRW